MFYLQLCSIIMAIIIIIITVTATLNTSTTLMSFVFVNIIHVHDLHDSTDFVTILLLNSMLKYYCVFCYDSFPASLHPLSMTWSDISIARSSSRYAMMEPWFTLKCVCSNSAITHTMEQVQWPPWLMQWSRCIVCSLGYVTWNC